MYRTLIMLLCCCATIAVASSDIDMGPQSEEQASSFEAFTGKVMGDKVRLRLQPHLDAPILREMNTGDLLIVDSESNDFFAAKPLADVKAYIFRTYVLDGLVEGTNVNVRLAPDIEAPVLTQLNTGDTVDGVISSLNNIGK